MKHFAKALIAILALITTACEHKPLIMPDEALAPIRIIFNWENISPDDIPQEMTLYFYAPDHQPQIRQVPVAAKQGIEVTLPADIYNIITYNPNDDAYSTDHLTWLQHAISLHQATGDLPTTLFGNTTATYRTPTNYLLPLAHPLPPIVGATLQDVDITTTTPDHITTITITPQYLTAHYDVTLTNFHIDRNIARVGAAALSGINATLLPLPTTQTGYCQPTTPTPVMTLPLTIQWAEAAAIATGQLHTFGVTTGQRQLLYIYIWSDSQSFLSRTYDVTDIIHDAPDPMNVHIVIDFQGIDTQAGDEPYTPQVDEWEEIQEEIQV